MECPHCHQTLPVLFCSECGKTPGPAVIAASVELIETIQEKEDTSDFSERTVCSDGNCISIINEKVVISAGNLTGTT
jgi:hypothetical protein